MIKKLFVGAMASTFILAGGFAHALERTSSTSGFNWGDDLSTVSDSIGGTTGQTASSSKIKSTHISDIREAITIAAQACGNVPLNVLYPSQDTQTLSMMGYPSKPLPALHINILRRAIEALYLAKYPGGTPSASTYFSGSVNQGERIQKAHIQQMRRALDDLVVSCGSGSGCFMKSFPTEISPGFCSGVVPIYRYYSTLALCEAATGSSPCFGGSACMDVCSSTCGNGTIESGEQCDDSNTINGDGCSSTCRSEACTIQMTSSSVVCKAFSDPANPACSSSGMSPGDVCVLPGPTCQMTSFENEFNLQDGPCDVPGPGGWWSGIVLDYGCVCGTGSAVCGNGTVESGEQCDDSNPANGDGCSSTCQNETSLVCDAYATWGWADECGGAVGGSTDEGAVYCGLCQCNGTFYRSTLTCSGGDWMESSPDSWFCFLGDTRVTMADGASKVMTELKEGDEVLGKGQVNRVKSVAIRQTSEPIYGFNGGRKFVTGGHPFWTKDGWKAIDPLLTPQELHGVHTEKLLIGDELWLKDGDYLKIQSIDAEVSGENTVYSPLVDGDHTYYADGLLAHNKSTDCPIGVMINPGPCSGAICGNGAVESGEQCDDSNTSNGDGCSSTCQTESGEICTFNYSGSCGELNDWTWGACPADEHCVVDTYSITPCSGIGSNSMGSGIIQSHCEPNISATCSDGIQNQGETGVDCGGPCAACAASTCWADGTVCYVWDWGTSTAWDDCSLCCSGTSHWCVGGDTACCG